jgi:hypothetical protein
LTSFHSILHGLELSAFDHAAVAYATGNFRNSGLRDLLTSCRSITNGHYPLESAAYKAHFQLLFRIIEECREAISGTIDFQSSFEEFSEQMESLQKWTARLRDSVSTIAEVRAGFCPTIPTVEPVSLRSDSLSNWFFGHLSSSRDRATLADLVSSVSFRICVARALQANVTSLRQLCDFQDRPDGAVCPHRAIERSPFMKIHEKECQFLRAAIGFLEDDRSTTALLCFAEDLEKFAAEYTAKTQLVMDDLRHGLDTLETSLVTRQRDVAELWAAVEGPIELALRSMSRDRQMPTDPGADSLQTLMDDEGNSGEAASFSLLVEARLMHARLCEKRALALAKVQSLSVIERKILEAAADAIKRDEEESRLKLELVQLTQYEQTLRDLIAEMKTGSDSSMLDNLRHVIHQFHLAILTHKQREEKAVAASVVTDAEIRIAELDEKIAERDEELKELDAKLLAANQERMKREEHAAILEGRKAVRGSDPTPVETQRMVAMVMCPICQKKPRNCLLKGCRHAICRDCLSVRDGKHCPVCGRSIGKSDIRPFLLGRT